MNWSCSFCNNLELSLNLNGSLTNWTQETLIFIVYPTKSALNGCKTAKKSEAVDLKWKNKGKGESQESHTARPEGLMLSCWVISLFLCPLLCVRPSNWTVNPPAGRARLFVFLLMISQGVPWKIKSSFPFFTTPGWQTLLNTSHVLVEPHAQAHDSWLIFFSVWLTSFIFNSEIRADLFVHQKRHRTNVALLNLQCDHSNCFRF